MLSSPGQVEPWPFPTIRRLNPEPCFSTLHWHLLHPDSVSKYPLEIKCFQTVVISHGEALAAADVTSLLEIPLASTASLMVVDGAVHLHAAPRMRRLDVIRTSAVNLDLLRIFVSACTHDDHLPMT